MTRHAKVKLVAVYLLLFLFPIGIWLELLGYEIASLACMIIGWTPIAYYFAAIFSSEITDELP